MILLSDGTRLAVSPPSGAVLLYPDDGSPPTAIPGFVGGIWWPAFTPKGDALLGWATQSAIPFGWSRSPTVGRSGGSSLVCPTVAARGTSGLSE